MMIRFMMRNVFNFAKFKIDEFNVEDYTTMCGLLKQKYQLNNEQIQTSGLVKLVDDKNKVIGIYTASEARKKSLGLGLDMVLVNMNTSPIICRASDFRSRIINKFYENVVLKRQRQMQLKASSIKSLRISPNLNANQMKIKLKQIVELSHKNLKVRVYMFVKETQRDQCLSKLQEIKSELLNKCYVEEEISNKRFQQEEKEEDDDDKYKQKVKLQTYSFVVRARDSNLVKKTLQEKEMESDLAVKTFLRKYYSQQDGEMMDLKSSGLFQVDRGQQLQMQIESKMRQLKIDEEQQKTQKQFSEDPELVKQAQARILNSRLKSLLSLYK